MSLFVGCLDFQADPATGVEVALNNTFSRVACCYKRIEDGVNYLFMKCIVVAEGKEEKLQRISVFQ